MGLNRLKYAALAITAPLALYLGLLGLLTTTWFQGHVVYLHALQMTWWMDLIVPEMFRFLHNQVTPFTIRSGDSIDLFCWHILPVGLYHRYEQRLLAEEPSVASELTK